MDFSERWQTLSNIVEHPLLRIIICSDDGEEILNNDNCINTYCTCLQLSQDYVENLFSIIRALGGADDHPTAQQMCTRVRQVKIVKDASILLKDRNLNVQLSTVEDDEEMVEPFVSAELGTLVFLLSILVMLINIHFSHCCF